MENKDVKVNKIKVDVIQRFIKEINNLDKLGLLRFGEEDIKDSGKFLSDIWTTKVGDRVFKCYHIISNFSFGKHISEKGSQNFLNLQFNVDESSNVYVYWYVKSSRRTSRRRNNLVIYDNDGIEFWTRQINNDHLITTENEIKSLSKRIMLEGYSVWGNKWGYITKEGRRARSILNTRYNFNIKYYTYKDIKRYYKQRSPTGKFLKKKYWTCVEERKYFK